jgi:hypothetical protein
MPRHLRFAKVGGIEPNVVIAAVMMQDASVIAKMSLQIHLKDNGHHLPLA